MHVVGMAVSIEHGVDTRDARIDELPMEVGRRVDEKTVPPASIRMETRRRRLRGSSDRHTGQAQPITGTPLDVPQPRIVIFMSYKHVEAVLS